MNTATEDQVRESAVMRLVAPTYGDIPAVYSNYMQAAAAPHDVTLYFGWYATPILAEAPTEVQEVPVRPVMAVSIPVGLLRGVIRVLEAQAAGWEETTGRTLSDLEAPADKEEDA